MPGRRTSPTVIQMEAAECGAAALAMVLAHHGLFVPLEQVRERCGVSRDGSRAHRMLRAARSYGLTAEGFSCEARALHELPLPQIVHWEYNHFVVLDDLDRDHFHINDPACGPRTVEAAEFERSFTGITLTFAPSEQFRPGGRRRSLVTSIGQRLEGTAGLAALIVAAGLLAVLPGLALPALAQHFVDEVLVGGQAGWVVPVLALTAIVTVFQAGLVWLQERWLVRLSLGLGAGGACRFLWHVLNLPMRFFDQRHGGEIAGRVAVADRVASVISDQVVRGLVGIVLVVPYAVVLALLNLPLTIVGLGLAAVQLVLLTRLVRARRDLAQNTVASRSRLASLGLGGLQAIETLKAAGREHEFFGRWAGALTARINDSQSLARVTLALERVPVLAAAVNETILLLLGGGQVLQGRMSLGALVAFQVLTPSLFLPLSRLVQMSSSLHELDADLTRLDDVLRCPTTDVPDRPVAPALTPSDVKLRGEVELANVTFGYSPLDPPLIAGLSLRVEPGQRVGVVGATGSGKSTVAGLVAGLHEPWSGSILLDGKPLATVPREALVGSLAHVGQEIFLFEGTVKENLTLWDTTVRFEDVESAARDACIHAEIAARPGGYDGHVEEAGANFSAGQRQRLEIARALVGNPTLLVLDEAFSALDPLTELQIDRNLRRRGLACLIVAHRLSTLRDCDEIVVLQDGAVVQRGCHERLMREDGPYRGLIRDDGDP